MKKRLFTLTCFLLGLLSFTTQAQIISVTPGTDFNIGKHDAVLPSEWILTSALGRRRQAWPAREAEPLRHRNDGRIIEAPQ